AAARGRRPLSGARPRARAWGAARTAARRLPRGDRHDTLLLGALPRGERRGTPRRSAGTTDRSVTSELQSAGLHVPSPVRWNQRAAANALPVTVAVVLCSFAALLTWNAVHYDWLRGYDAWQNWRYEQTIAHGHLPSRADTDEWHNPPLFYAVAYVAQSIGGEKAVQFVGVASAIGLVLFAF